MRKNLFELIIVLANFAAVIEKRLKRVAASALPPASRDGFLQMVAGKLSAYPPEARGPGLVHRLAAEAQRAFLNVAVGAGGKYR